MRPFLVFAATCIAAAVAAAGESSAQPSGGKQSVVELDGLKSAVPAGWTAEKPGSTMRHAQYRIAKVDGDSEDAQLVVFFFGKGSGGSVDDNLKRWKGEFAPAGDKDTKAESKLDTFKVGAVKVTLLDVSGVFLSKSSPTAANPKIDRKADYRMFAVIFESPNGPYFFKMTGPARTMAQHKQGFDDWLKNFK
jgi:hypothetical protein